MYDILEAGGIVKKGDKMKNKSLITNICLSVVSVLVLVFLALPFLGQISGYDFLQLLQYLGQMDFGTALVYIAPLFMLIASIVLLIFSVLNLLGDLNVIKSEKLLKVSRIVSLVAAIVLAVFVLLAFILILAKEATPAYALIISLILGIAALAGSILICVWNKK